MHNGPGNSRRRGAGDFGADSHSVIFMMPTVFVTIVGLLSSNDTQRTQTTGADEVGDDDGRRCLDGDVDGRAATGHRPWGGA